jgi:hypothetical protein
MTSIPLTGPGESEPLAICRSNRSWLVDRYKIDAMIALRYYSDEMPLSERDASSDNKATEHIRKCPKCREWINSVIPKPILQRQHRLTKYCCAGMFVAIEESQKGKNKITFQLFRGEDPCWMIDGVNSFITFCPWCGKKLPDKPFIQ